MFTRNCIPYTLLKRSGFDADTLGGNARNYVPGSCAFTLPGSHDSDKLKTKPKHAFVRTSLPPFKPARKSEPDPSPAQTAATVSLRRREALNFTAAEQLGQLGVGLMSSCYPVALIAILQAWTVRSGSPKTLNLKP